MSERPVDPPDFPDLVGELSLVRRQGITRLRELSLPAMVRATRAAGLVDADDVVGPPQIEELVLQALDELGGGRLGECAALILGLEPGTRGYTPTELRRDAAERWGVSEARFRRDPQTQILTQLAEAMLRRCQQHRERLAHLNLERRLPPTSRLAVAWLERFEAYYRVWTPMYGLGADLTAYRSTLVESDRPYDREPSDEEPDGYSQEFQAAGYITFALWHYTCVLIEVQRYLTRYGGMWLLSDAQAEQNLADAIYRATWHSPNNERDDSYLRWLHDRANGELHPFLNLIKTESIGRATHEEWQDWAAGCSCNWSLAEAVSSEQFPTHRHHPEIDARCQLHSLVAACSDFCALVDDGWRRIADWYRLPPERPNGVSGETLYDSLRIPGPTDPVDSEKGVPKGG